MMLLSLSKKLDINRVFILMLVYQKKAISLDEFSRMLEYLHVANSVYIVAEDFKYNLSKVSPNKLLNHMIGYTLVVHEPTQISGSQIAYIYVKSALLKSFIQRPLFKTFLIIML